MRLVPRPYQSQAIDEIRAHYSAGRRRVLLHLATGGGKTFIFSMVLKGVQARGKRAIMVVDGKDLVDQASQRLRREGVDHGCLQANHWNRRPDASIQVCSIDTLYARGIAPPADLIVIDEAHLATIKSRSWNWLMAQYPDTFVLAVTATPHVKNGLRHLADHVVYPITIGSLIEQGYLMPPRYFAPTSPDLTGVGTDSATGDYKTGELGVAMSGTKLFGDMVSAYRQHADGRPAVCFAVTRDHSRALAATFAAAGIPAVHVEADTTPRERRRALDALESGTVRVVCNVGILCVGVDMPYLGAVIMARPTRSYNLFVQQIGRGTRPFPGKSDFVVLDHANNLREHGMIEFERECDLDGIPLRSASDRRPVICKQCFMAFLPDPEIGKICPGCGFDNADHSSGSERVIDVDETAKMVEMKAADGRSDFVARLCETATARGYKPGWVFHKVKTKYGEGTARSFWRQIKARVPSSTDENSRCPSLANHFDAFADRIVQGLAPPDWSGLS